MCTGGDQAPGSVAEALAMARAGLGYLAGPAADGLDAASVGEVLQALASIASVHAAARSVLVQRFDAADGHDADGYGSTWAWLAARAKMTRKDAKAAVRQSRRLASHPVIAAAVADQTVSESWGLQAADWTGRLPAEMREDTDKILMAAAAAGADLDDLAMLANAAYEAWKASRPDPDEPPDPAFANRYIDLGITLEGAGRVTGNLTPECGAALQAVLDALGKKRGPEDDRNAGERFHDALQEGCELLIRAKMVPDRAGADTRVHVHIGLGQLRGMPGASQLEAAWLAGDAANGWLAGDAAQAAACDALIVPVVTGHADWVVIDQMIELAFTAISGPADGASEPGPPPLSAQARAELARALARLAIDFVSGPGGLASCLRRGLSGDPCASRSLPLDIGYSESVPAAIRTAVTLRDRHCAWPGCERPPAACDVHHIVHLKDGGTTTVWNCILLCQFHQNVCIHRWGWQIILHRRHH